MGRGKGDWGVSQDTQIWAWRLAVEWYREVVFKMQIITYLLQGG